MERKFAIRKLFPETLMEDIRTVVWKRSEFDYEKNYTKMKSLVTLTYQVSVAREQTKI